MTWLSLAVQIAASNPDTKDGQRRLVWHLCSNNIVGAKIMDIVMREATPAVVTLVIIPAGQGPGDGAGGMGSLFEALRPWSAPRPPTATMSHKYR